MVSTVENDLTKNIAQPAVIIANVRTGGTFLAHCLSNHSQIFCDRAESLHHSSIWNRTLKIKQDRLLHCLLHMQGYNVSMTKLTYNQAASNWNYLIKTQPLVLWLRRENVIRQAVSVIINKMGRKKQVEAYQHSFNDVMPVSVAIEPDKILSCARELKKRDNGMGKKLSQSFNNVLPLTYAEITGGERADARLLEFDSRKKICEFLGVPTEVLSVDLRPINPRPLSETLKNWNVIKNEIKNTEFAELIDNE